VIDEHPICFSGGGNGDKKKARGEKNSTPHS
jgi:hypothetical protein